MRNKKRVLSGGVVVLTVFLVLGVCKPDIDKFCRQNRSITAFLPVRVSIRLESILEASCLMLQHWVYVLYWFFLLLVISALVFIAFRIGGRSSKPIRL